MFWKIIHTYLYDIGLLLRYHIGLLREGESWGPCRLRDIDIVGQPQNWQLFVSLVVLMPWECPFCSGGCAVTGESCQEVQVALNVWQKMAYQFRFNLIVLFCFVLCLATKTLQIHCSRCWCPLLGERHAALQLITGAPLARKARARPMRLDSTVRVRCGPLLSREHFVAFQGGNIASRPRKVAGLAGLEGGSSE